MKINYIYVVLSLIFIVMSFLPIFNIKHWFFRIADYLRVQLIGLLLIMLVIGFTLEGENTIYNNAIFALLLVSILHHLIIIFPYVFIKNKSVLFSENKLSLLSVNVLQKNKNYDGLIKMIKEVNPDILLTMETNKKWEKALSEIELDFEHTYKIPKENRYGMHLFTKLKVEECKVHYLISEEHPSIEIRLKDKENNEFVFWGIHPPPPSPTEKPTSKQKEAELMKVAKSIRKHQLPTIVSGDFNTVCWSKSSKQFAKLSNLADARLKRGIYGTFPAQFWFLRFPVDLLYHSESIVITKLKTLPPWGSDHLPLFSEFFIRSSTFETKNYIDSEFKEEVNTIIEEGKKAAVEEN